MGNKQLVLAFFGTEEAADTAVDSLKQWDKASKEIKLGSIGVLVKNEDGKIKTQKVGAKHTKTGVLGGVLAAALSGGVTLLAGAVVGGITGSFLHKGLGLSDEDMTRISSELDGGKAAVAVLAGADEADAVSAKLVELGGQAETHEVTDEAIEEATAVVEAAPTEDEASA